MSDATTPLPEAVLARAARLRAEGSSWTHVAAALAPGRESDEVRQLCEATGETFDRLLGEAHDEVVRDAHAEAILALRVGIRSRSRKVSRRSAEVMVRVAAAERRDRIARERLQLQRQRHEAQAAASERRDRLARERQEAQAASAKARERLAREKLRFQWTRVAEEPEKWLSKSMQGRELAKLVADGRRLQREEEDFDADPRIQARIAAGRCSFCGSPYRDDDYDGVCAGTCGGDPAPRDPSPPADDGTTGATPEAGAASAPAGDAPAAPWPTLAPEQLRRERIWGLPLE